MCSLGSWYLALHFLAFPSLSHLWTVLKLSDAAGGKIVPWLMFKYTQRVLNFQVSRFPVVTISEIQKCKCLSFTVPVSFLAASKCCYYLPECCQLVWFRLWVFQIPPSLNIESFLFAWLVESLGLAIGSLTLCRCFHCFSRFSNFSER